MTSVSNALSVTLEFVRVDQGGDPHAFRMTRQEYLLRSAGGGFQSAELGWDEALLADLEALRRPQPEPVRLQRLGETLRHFLHPAGWSEHEAAIVAAVQARRSVVLTLRSAAAELYALPWELVTIKSTGQHLAELPGVLVRYEWPETTTMPASAPLPKTGGRILVAWSSAGGAVPATEHLAAIERACGDSGHPFSQERDVLSHVTTAKLADALESAQSQGEPIAVLHLLCHGGVVGESFGLMLDGEDSAAHIIDAGHLRRLLTPYAGMIRLVVLSACHGSDSGALGNQLGSVAQALHRAGIAQVVASRYPLSVAGSIRLAQVLYHHLLNSTGSLEAALLRARDSLARQDGQADWVSLQLFARASDGEFQRPGYLPTSATVQTPSAAPPSTAAAPQFTTDEASRSGIVREPSAIAPRATRLVTPWNVGGLLFLAAIGGFVWRVHRTPSQPVHLVSPTSPRPLDSGSSPGAGDSVAKAPQPPDPATKLTVALVAAPESAPVKGHKHSRDHARKSDVGNPNAPASAADTADKPNPPPTASTMPVYRGVLLSGSSPISSAKLTLVGTDCETSTDDDGVFSFKSCRDEEGVGRLTTPGVIVKLPASENETHSCAGKVISIEQPPAMTRIDILEHCKARDATPKTPASAAPVQTNWLNAGPIWNSSDAQSKCPKVCANAKMKWHAPEWTTKVPMVMATCKCETIPASSSQ